MFKIITVVVISCCVYTSKTQHVNRLNFNDSLFNEEILSVIDFSDSLKYLNIDASHQTSSQIKNVLNNPKLLPLNQRLFVVDIDTIITIEQYIDNDWKSKYWNLCKSLITDKTIISKYSLDPKIQAIIRISKCK